MNFNAERPLWSSRHVRLGHKPEVHFLTGWQAWRSFLTGKPNLSDDIRLTRLFAFHCASSPNDVKSKENIWYVHIDDEYHEE